MTLLTNVMITTYFNIVFDQNYLNLVKILFFQ